MSEALKRGRQSVLKSLRARGLREPASDYQLELQCLAASPFGHSIRYEFLISAMKMQWGDAVVMEADGKENYWFKRIAWNFCHFRFLTLLGCAASGKTLGASACAYTCWKSSPWNSTVILSTTDDKANDARGWGNISDLYDRDKFKIGVKLPYKKAIVLEPDGKKEERDYRDAILGVAIRTGEEGKAAIGSISGRHNENVTWLCDELVHMQLAVLSGRVNMVANTNFQWVGIGNKPNEGDPLYVDAEPYGDGYPNGWQSVNPDEAKKWTTRTGVCLYFDGLRSPNFQFPKEEKARFPGIMNYEMLDGMRIASFGEDSPDWWRQVRGFPNSGDIQDRVLTAKMLTHFGATEQVVWQGSHWTTVAGLDLGQKEDGDPCVADFARVGTEAAGRTIMAHEQETVQLTHKVQGSSLPYEQQIAAIFLDECEKRDCHLVALDISGGGGKMALAIKSEATVRAYGLEIISVEFGGTASEEEYDVGGRRAPAKELFDRRVSELWYSYALAVQNRIVRGVSLFARATKQLCERKVIQDEKKRFSVETKRKMKLRTRRSPDDGDARCLCHVAARQSGLSRVSTLEDNRKVEIDWEDVKEEMGHRQRYGGGYRKTARYAGR
jgi:hypothetical protein